MTDTQKDRRIKVLKEKISTYKDKLITEQKYNKVLDQQYKRVVESYRKQIQDMKSHIPKYFALYLAEQIRKIKI